MSSSDIPKLLRTSVKPVHRLADSGFFLDFTLKVQILICFEEVVHNYGKSDDDMI